MCAIESSTIQYFDHFKYDKNNIFDIFFTVINIIKDSSYVWFAKQSVNNQKI